MSRSRLYRTDAIILRRTDRGEADRLLTIFTPNFGKLRIMARGVRKIASRRAGHVELFTVVDLLLAKGRTHDVLSQVETVQSYRHLSEDLERMSQAYYLAELVDSFTEEKDTNQPLFELLVVTLAHINFSTDFFLAVRYFEVQLLSLTGFQPQLHICLVCHEPLQPIDNFFHYQEGGALCPRHGQTRPGAVPLPLPVLKVLRFMQTQPWENVAKLQLSPETQTQLEQLLTNHISFILERRLKSIKFIEELRRF